MDISALRSSLQHRVPDLQLLTTAELNDCKWAVVKKVLVPLLDMCPSLREFNEELVALLEVRNQEVAQLRKASEGRERRLESEMNFRTSFLRIIIAALTHLRWPPALEPFADPMNSLMNDSSTTHSAIYHLLEFGLPKDLHRFSRSSSSSLDDHRPRSGNVNDKQPRTHDNNDEQVNISLDRPASKEVSTPRDGITREDSSRRRAPVTPTDVSHNNSFISETTSSSSYQQQNQRTPNARQFQNNENSYSKSASMGGSSAYEQPSDEFIIEGNMRKSLEILQHQNESLSRRLKLMQESVCARDKCEQRLSLLIRDLQSVVDEVAGIGKSSGSSSNSSSSLNNTTKGSKDAGISRSADDDDTSPRDGGQQSKEVVQGPGKLHQGTGGVKTQPLSFRDDRLAARLDSVLGINNNNATTTSTTSSSSGDRYSYNNHHSSSSSGGAGGGGSDIVWKKLQKRVQGLQQEWEEARRDARGSVLAKIDVHRGSQSFLQAQCTTTNPGGHSSGSASARAGQQQSSSISTAAAAGGGERASRVLLHRILGVRPPLALLTGAINEDGGGGAMSSSPLDLSRVHTLQRDFLDVSDCLERLCSGGAAVADSKEDNTANIFHRPYEQPPSPPQPQKQQQRQQTKVTRRTQTQEHSLLLANQPDPFPLNHAKADQVDSVSELRLRCSSLALHLSCLAPLAPLAVDAPQTSSRTGLEILESELAPILNAKSRSSSMLSQGSSGVGSSSQGSSLRKIQGALDRARAEQSALARRLHSSESMLRQWSKATIRTAPMVQQFLDTSRGIAGKGYAELKQLEGAFKSVTDALLSAEAVRIQGGLEPAEGSNSGSSGGGSSTTMKGGGARKSSGSVSAAVDPSQGIAPLDSLSRGCMGREVAALVNALRIAAPDLVEAADRIKDTRVTLNKEIEKQLSALERAKTQALSAADITDKEIVKNNISVAAATGTMTRNGAVANSPNAKSSV